jgi:ABC-type nitrate/sulfonate/bicarbonate transport system ATPase subunit
MLPWLTLAANVGLPLRMRRVPRSEARERAMALLTSFGLRNAAALYPAQLSGGMKKRGLLARALIYQPRLLLMDEPFAALDAQMREQLQSELRRAVMETGVAVLFVTHDLEEAALLSDRVVVIGGTPGRVIDEVAIGLGQERDAETLRFDDTSATSVERSSSRCGAREEASREPRYDIGDDRTARGGSGRTAAPRRTYGGRNDCEDVPLASARRRHRSNRGVEAEEIP